MSNKNKPTRKNPTLHRPLLPTPAAIDNIKQQFAEHITNKVVVQGADYKKEPEKEVSEEQQHAEAQQQAFYPFPASGMICEWVSNPTRPGVFVVVVNIEPDATKEPRPGFFATCRQPEVAQMLCDGVNFLFKCQKEMEKAGLTGEAVQPTVLGPVTVDENTPPTVE
jgi:hypothetical protein